MKRELQHPHLRFAALLSALEELSVEQRRTTGFQIGLTDADQRRRRRC
jgi:hypothetical protein